jgi:SAM-dependent methyltransferase
MDDPVRTFYDRLAPGYHRIFADWHASIGRQAGILGRLIERELGAGPRDILDAAAGIGTQALGLAALGHRVHATDLSPAAIDRLRHEAATAGVEITTDVADLRLLGNVVDARFDVVMACDNALPHLLTDEDVHMAVAQMSARLRRGGLFLASIRDYDRLADERPTGELPRVVDDQDGRRISFQVWEWAADGRTYRLHQFIVRRSGDGWQTDHAEVEYRALRRAELELAVATAGLSEMAWHEPADTGFHQPIITARALP